MSIESATYKLVRPNSSDDSGYEDFEFLLAWYSKTGQYINYLFTDWENEQENENVILNRLNVDKMQSVHSSEYRRVTLTFENVTRNDLLIYSSVLQAKKAVRVFKDGTFQRVGINSTSLSYRQTDGRYNFEISVELYEKDLPR